MRIQYFLPFLVADILAMSKPPSDSTDASKIPTYKIKHPGPRYIITDDGRVVEVERKESGRYQLIDGVLVRVEYEKKTGGSEGSKTSTNTRGPK
uniref:PWT4 protein n=1 Tax=Pyricularia oryzae TaxID=318829 RepID=A0A224A3U7_PYROR|nr:PWT4 [Pyricularia oryzae]